MQNHRYFHRIRAVFFDAGHTLLKPDPSVEERYTHTAAKYGMPAQKEELRKRFSKIWKEGRKQREQVLYKTDKQGTKQFWRDFVVQVFEPWISPSVDFDAFFKELYLAFATKNAWRLFDDVIPGLKQIQKLGYPLGVISNWDHRLHQIIADVGISHFFEVVVTSAEVGYEKPAQPIFEHALQRLGVEPEEALHIGDSLEDDVRGAWEAGLQPVYLQRSEGQPKTPVPDRLATFPNTPVVSSLLELANQLISLP